MRLFQLNRAARILLGTNAMILLAGAMLGPIYALFVEDIGGDLLDASIAWAVFALAAGFTTLITGKYADKIKESELILVLGYVWSKVLFPHRNALERVVFSFLLGIFAMPISIFIPFTFITVATVFSTLLSSQAPAFVGPVLGSADTGIVGLFIQGQEQIYEFANVFFFLVLGAILLALKTIMRKSPASSKIQTA